MSTETVKTQLMRVIRLADVGPDGLGGDLTYEEVESIAKSILLCFKVEAK